VANTNSAKKEARRSVGRAQRNRSAKSAVKTTIVRFRRALTEGTESADNWGQLATAAVSALDRAASKGIVHRNNAARRKSRLTKRLNAVVAAPAETVEAPKTKASRKTAKPAARRSKKT
jgi:small subunit ribosomal protein S20